VDPAVKLVSLTASFAEFIFSGRFQDREVTWQCQLVSLAGVAQANRQASQRQFIEILPQAGLDQEANPVYQIRVGLNLAEINMSAIEKTIIMVRNYKRLQTGRHEYGEIFEFTLE